MKKLLTLLTLIPIMAAGIVVSNSYAITVIKFSNGYYVDSPNGPVPFDLTVIDATGTMGPNPGPNPVPKEDKYGLIKASRESADAVIDYTGKTKHRATLAAVTEGLAASILAGTIPEDKLLPAIEASYKFVLGNDLAKWAVWRATTGKIFAEAPIQTAEDAAKGLQDIAEGLLPESDRSENIVLALEGMQYTVASIAASSPAMASSTIVADFFKESSDALMNTVAAAINWERLIELFIQYILPLIIKLIEGV